MNAPLKTKNCRICKEPYVQFNSLQPTCGKFDCQLKFAVNHANKSDAVRKKAERKQLREAKLKIKTRQQWLKEVQSEINRFVRLRDANQPCISCQRFHSGQYHAGHYRTVGACPSLRFEESNIHKQCSACNNHLSGNIVEYRINLLKKIGAEKLAWIEGPHEPKHYSIDDLIELKAHYKAKVKELEGATDKSWLRSSVPMSALHK